MQESRLITSEYVKTVIKERKRELHKGEAGRILLIAGSVGMAGAAVLCSRGALRAGAGLVTAAIPKELFEILQISVPEVICMPRTLSKLDLSRYDAIAIGPGLGDDAENEGIVEAVLAEYRKTVVLDADGLNTLARYDKVALLKKSAAQVIITPHVGEARRLLNMAESDLPGGRQEMVDKLAVLTGAIIVLKGAGSLVTSSNCCSYTNTTGNPGMATGGSGDVLTGIIAALSGQGVSPLDAAKAGVFIHGLAGDIVAECMGEYGMTAGDIAETTGLAIKRILDK